MKPATFEREDYNTLRARWVTTVAACAIKARPFPPVPPGGWWLWFEWRCADKKRDPGNVASAEKLVTDGLVAAGVMPNDTAASVAGFVHTFVYGVGDGVRVLASRFEEGPWWRSPAWSVEVPHRLPGANEMRAAVEVGVRRQLRKRAERDARFEPRGRRAGWAGLVRALLVVGALALGACDELPPAIGDGGADGGCSKPPAALEECTVAVDQDVRQTCPGWDERWVQMAVCRSGGVDLHVDCLDGFFHCVPFCPAVCQ